ncbi:MurR/RpiR family transcriptional regulator [Paremcibacter congregatus]|nr:MurR/RpiR family transcriptional regulator [Paremcibacter congregatus]QDE28863.1 MurR/RpiR family transcriptional regulator [Paremcibacter congregatus]
MKDCLGEMQRSVREMSGNGRKLADFILNNASLLRDYSSQQLAEAVGVSQSSVVKFSQKLGYRGYPDLKLAVSEDLGRGGTTQSDLVQAGARTTPAMGGVFEDIARMKRDILNTIAELNQEEVLLDVVRVLEEAHRIQFVAAGGYSLLLKDFSLKLMIMGKSVIAESDLFLQKANLASMKRGDVLLAVSVSGQNSQIVDLAETAKEAGVTVISVTEYDVNPLSLCADLSLFLCSEEAVASQIEHVPHIAGRVALQHIIDALFLLLSNRNAHMRELLIDSRRASGHS